jgi:protein-tyrosine phosphatase
MRILFVCLGNICRSPMAEGVMRHLAHASGSKLQLDSAGTGGWHAGEPPDHRAQAAMRRRGMDISDLRARQARPDDFERFDLLLAMDADNLRELRRMAPAADAHRAKLIMDFAPDHHSREVPDPYYGGDEGFDAVGDMLEAACRGVLDTIAR